MEDCFVILESTDREEYRRNVALGRKKDREQFEPFIGKKVTIETASKNILQGRIVVTSNNNDMAFMRKGQSVRGKIITAGLFDGWQATITIRRIKKGWK